MYKTSGLLFFFGGTLVLVGILLAEIFYPGYSITGNMISDLASSRPPHSIIRQPSAEIFNTAMILAGVCVISGGFILRKQKGMSWLGLITMMMGVGTLGVGIFPAFHSIMHPVSAGVAFFVGAFAAVFSSRFMKSPLSYVSVGLGSVSLGFLIVGILSPSIIVPIFGVGGTERLVAYPTIIWLIAYGGYLMGYSK